MNKAGRPRDPNSIDSLGRVVIAVDRPCREDLKKQANARQLTLVEYMRLLADQGNKKPIQIKGWKGAPGVEPSQNAHAFMRVIDNLSAALAVGIADNIKFYGDTQEELDQHIKLLTWTVNAEYAQSRLEGAKELLRIRQEQIAQREQLPLDIKLEKGVAKA